jgi:hypothetical protein
MGTGEGIFSSPWDQKLPAASPADNVNLTNVTTTAPAEAAIVPASSVKWLALGGVLALLLLLFLGRLRRGA